MRTYREMLDGWHVEYDGNFSGKREDIGRCVENND